MTLSVDVFEEIFPVAGSFTISRGARTAAHVVTLELRRGGFVGRAECVPYARYNETATSVIDTVKRTIERFDGSITREKLLFALPAGAARNVLDCALWELEAKECGLSVWQLAGLDAPNPVTTAFTISLASPNEMERAARENAGRPLLKIKLGKPDDMERLRAVRRGAPEASLIVDANEGWSVEDYLSISPVLSDLNVVMVEQPLPAGKDEALMNIPRVVPVCADESCRDLASLRALDGKYDAVNIKLDKAGGLTEALALADAASASGYVIMVGCMLGTSLGMAPAQLLAQKAKFTDLDAPLLLARDRANGIQYEGSVMYQSPRALWGG